MTDVREATVRGHRSGAITRIVRVLLAVVFLYVGAQKLFLGGGVWIRLFDQIGFGPWFRYFTAFVEMAAGALMLIPRWSTVGAVLAISSMIGALIVHATVIGFGPPTVSVLLLLALSGYVAWSGRRQIPAAIQFKLTRKGVIGCVAGLLALYMGWNAPA